MRAPALPKQRGATGDDSVEPSLRRGIAAVAERLARLATEPDATFPPLAADTADGRFGALAESFGLTALDLTLLLPPLAASLDPRLAVVSRRLDGRGEAGWPSAGLALTVLGLSGWDAAARGRLAPTAPLVRFGLLHVGDGERPFPARTLRLPDRLVAHLLGSDDVDDAVQRLLAPLVPAEVTGAERLAAALERGLWLCWVREHGRASGHAFAAAALDRLSLAGLGVDLRRLPDGAGLADVLVPALQEATLRGAALVIGPVDLHRDRAVLPTVADPPCPVVLVGPEHWNPQAAPVVPFTVDAAEPDAEARLTTWREVLGRLDGAEPPAEIATFRLTPEQIVLAAASATVQAGDGAPGAAELAAAARAQNAGRLERLVRRVTPAAGFDRLVLGDTQLRDVREVIDRYRTLELVRDVWGAGGAHSSRGVTALFYGPSGTGKTLSAEVVAHELGVDLFVIDLSQVVDKYIGETEKNLEHIFSEAENVNGVLFFDEADALFGKRSDVKDAHDRHANVEVAYLLQRMERFEGVAVLATNLQANIDEAFSRRLDVVCDFRNPGEDERRRLWRLHLPATLPQADDIDVELLARVIDTPGGDIRNMTLAAAHVAAAAGREVTMADLVQAAVVYHRKRGRMLKSPELAAYADLG